MHEYSMLLNVTARVWIVLTPDVVVEGEVFMVTIMREAYGFEQQVRKFLLC